MQWQDKLQKKLPRADGEKRGTKKEIISLEKKLSMNGEMLDLAYLSYQSVLELEKFTRRDMQQVRERHGLKYCFSF
jgi:hypothetical protein